jgi:hypothetical protein
MKPKTENRKLKTVRATDGSSIATLGPGLRFDFGPRDRALAIAKVVLTHQGAEEAITIEGIAKALWPTEWGMIVPDSHGNPKYKHRGRLQREIKGHIADLVNLEKQVIVSNRGHRNPGYFIPVRKEEIDAAVRTFTRQALCMLSRAHKLNHDPRYAEMAGQLTLMSKDKVSGAGCQVSGEAR